jgi:DNA-binding PadR family transcriptional regulator
MAESTLLALLARYPNAVAIARRVSASTLHEGLRRLERAGLVVGGHGVYRVTRRGRAALQFDAALRASVRRALHS